jgi:dTDP-4-amino-4,6-dideoxygalactose transaminase
MSTDAPIPFVDLKAQYAAICGEVGAAIQAALDETAFIMGARVRDFEAEFAAFIGARHAIATSSGTTALHLALIAAGVGPGDEVLCPSHTFIATAEAVCHCGATPVFVDIEPETYCIDPALIEAAITPRTKAIIPVHLYGQAADMDAIMPIAERHGLTVVEDCAQSHGAKCGDRTTGTAGAFGCFSFFPGKNLGAYGDGGMVTTNDGAAARRIRLLANHGREAKYEHEIIGYNYRLDALQAAVLRVKLRHLPEWNEARRHAAHRYSELLRGLPVETPIEKRGHVYHLYVIQCENRDGLAKALQAAGVATGVHYPLPLHMQPCFSHLPGGGPGNLPVTERTARRILSLPIYPEVTESQQRRVVETASRELH